jgi:hypothetical protein
VIYVVSDQVDVLGAAWEQLCDSELGAAFTTASTLLGVAQLGFPGQLIEVDLTAALRLRDRCSEFGVWRSGLGA